MIGFIRGTVLFVDHTSNEIIIDAGNAGVGYRVLIAAPTDALPNVGDSLQCHIYTQVRDDAIELFGFKTKEERTLFTKLVTVKGVGAKSALAILCALSPAEFQNAILTSDAAALKKIPSIGPKVAARLILELEAYMKSVSFGDFPIPHSKTPTTPHYHPETRSALSNLGFSDTEIDARLSALDDANLSLDVQGEITWCLRYKG